MKQDDVIIYLICLKALFPIFIGIGIIIILISDNSPRSIDDSINKSQEMICLLDVVDSTGNGFCVHYSTEYAVTRERYDEIFSRRELWDAFNHIQKELPEHFGGNLLETDIYDFAAELIKYPTTDGVHVDCIFVQGPEKTAFYAQPNPNLPDGVTWFDVRTKQGALWIKHDDVYYCRGKEERIYRYYKCPGMREFSRTDERYTHYTEEEKIY